MSPQRSYVQHRLDAHLRNDPTRSLFGGGNSGAIHGFVSKSSILMYVLGAHFARVPLLSAAPLCLGIWMARFLKL
jgi:hypothetical protein